MVQLVHQGLSELNLPDSKSFRDTKIGRDTSQVKADADHVTNMWQDVGQHMEKEKIGLQKKTKQLKDDFSDEITNAHQELVAHIDKERKKVIDATEEIKKNVSDKNEGQASSSISM